MRGIKFSLRKKKGFGLLGVMFLGATFQHTPVLANTVSNTDSPNLELVSEASDISSPNSELVSPTSDIIENNDFSENETLKSPLSSEVLINISDDYSEITESEKNILIDFARGLGDINLLIHNGGFKNNSSEIIKYQPFTDIKPLPFPKIDESISDKVEMALVEGIVSDYFVTDSLNSNYKVISDYTKTNSDSNYNFFQDISKRAPYDKRLFIYKRGFLSDYKPEMVYEFEAGKIYTNEELIDIFAPAREIYAPKITYDNYGYTSLLSTAMIGHYYDYSALDFENLWTFRTLKDGFVLSITDVVSDVDLFDAYFKGVAFLRGHPQLMFNGYGRGFLTPNGYGHDSKKWHKGIYGDEILLTEDGIFVKTEGYRGNANYVNPVAVKIPDVLLKKQFRELYKKTTPVDIIDKIKDHINNSPTYKEEFGDDLKEILELYSEDNIKEDAKLKLKRILEVFDRKKKFNSEEAKKSFKEAVQALKNEASKIKNESIEVLKNPKLKQKFDEKVVEIEEKITDTKVKFKQYKDITTKVRNDGLKETTRELYGNFSENFSDLSKLEQVSFIGSSAISVISAKEKFVELYTFAGDVIESKGVEEIDEKASTNDSELYTDIKEFKRNSSRTKENDSDKERTKGGIVFALLHKVYNFISEILTNIGQTLIERLGGAFLTSLLGPFGPFAAKVVGLASVVGLTYGASWLWGVKIKTWIMGKIAKEGGVNILKNLFNSLKVLFKKF